jgi:hypothetical protein
MHRARFGFTVLVVTATIATGCGGWEEVGGDASPSLGAGGSTVELPGALGTLANGPSLRGDVVPGMPDAEVTVALEGYYLNGSEIVPIAKATRHRITATAVHHDTGMTMTFQIQLNTYERKKSYSDIYRYQGEAQDKTGAKLFDLCQDHAGTHAMFLPYRWDENGKPHKGAISVVCHHEAASGKCAGMFNYRPWIPTPITPPSSTTHEDLYHACTLALRADYCGTGQSWTSDGWFLNIYDTHGINSSMATAGYSLEAVFDAGAARSLSSTARRGDPSAECPLSSTTATVGSSSVVTEVNHMKTGTTPPSYDETWDRSWPFRTPPLSVWTP